MRDNYWPGFWCGLLVGFVCGLICVGFSISIIRHHAVDKGYARYVPIDKYGNGSDFMWNDEVDEKARDGK